ncbi:MAG: CoA transferase [Proteobacteria bacterium]|nr:CoA transferase [Pseudomonadota bacterium]
MSGPLTGMRVVEIAGIGPGPFCAMMLADHGAEVIRVERVGAPPPGRPDILLRSRRSIAVDLKQASGVAVVRDLCRKADALIEGFRPGVMERLGLAPEVLLADNPRLVYGRVTGWGQTGPLASCAGHDIDYIATSGVLHAIGAADGPPLPPLNLVGDFGGGGMLLAFGVLSALHSAQRSGKGQVVDCSMCEGSALLMSMMWSLRAAGIWTDERGRNVLDGGAHFYGTYATADGKYVAIGAIEPHFYAELCRRIGFEGDTSVTAQLDRANWPRLREQFAALFLTRTRAQWIDLLQDSDTCFAPVLGMSEAPAHPHNVARNSFIEVDDVVQPAPVPRYSQAMLAQPRAYAGAGAHTRAILHEAGYSDERIDLLQSSGVIQQAPP